jgi:hypothetical protein
MSKKSSTDTIKSLSPKNVSGSLKDALDAIQNLKKSKGNPKMVDAVGAGPLGGILQQVSQMFSKQSKNQSQQEHEQEKKDQEEFDKNYAESLKARLAREAFGIPSSASPLSQETFDPDAIE